MTTYDSGVARAAYILDVEQPKRAAAELRALFSGIQQQALALGKVNPSVNAAPSQQASERAILSRASAEARLAQIQNTGKNTLAGLTQAESIYQQALAKVDQTSIAAIRTQSQLAAVQNRIQNVSGGGLSVLPRSLENFGPQALQQIQSGLLGVVGPAALVTAGFAAAKGSIDSFVDAFKFKAELDATNLSIKTNLDGIRDSGVVLNEAAQFAARYRVSQKETSDILAASTDILRVSTSSVGDLESALLRLQSRDVSKPISEAARALRELNSGDVTSIKELFNVPAKEALRMKNEIAAGGDAVVVLNAYLERASVGMEVLENRAKGAAGAMNEQVIAQEKLRLAQAKFAEGPGIAFTDFKTNALKEFTALLTGDFTEIEARNAARIKGQEAYNVAIQQGKTDAEAMAIGQQVLATAERDAAVASLQAANATLQSASAYDANRAAALASSEATFISADALSKEARGKLESQIVTAGLAQQQAQLDADSRRAAVGLLGAGDQALILAQKYGIATAQAQFLINAQQALSNATALADQRVGERDPSNTLTAKQTNDFSKLTAARRKEDAAKADADAKKAKADADQLRGAQNSLNLARATTKEQKIAELLRQQKATSDPVEKLRLQAQIEQERRAGAGRVGAAQSTALQLQNTEQNSQLQLLRTQREGQERIRDAQLDFDIRKSRSAEDFQEDYRKLLEKGQRAQAAELKRDFEKDQRRAQEDFQIQQRRTNRNNAEGIGDIGARTDLRQEQIGNRAALRGVKTGTPPASLGGGTPPAALGGAHGGSGQRVISITFPSAIFSPDGQKLGDIVYPFVSQRIDDDLAIEIRTAPALGGGQVNVAGARP